jgi:hypothetical protein
MKLKLLSACGPLESGHIAQAINRQVCSLLSPNLGASLQSLGLLIALMDIFGLNN